MYYKALILISSFSFFFYSFRSVFYANMASEYSRWGFGNFRVIIATFQFICAIGLLLGIYYKTLLSLSSLSLFIMMLGAIAVRIRIKDSLLKTFPAVFYALINFIIFYNSFLSLYN